MFYKILIKNISGTTVNNLYFYCYVYIFSNELPVGSLKQRGKVLCPRIAQLARTLGGGIGLNCFILLLFFTGVCYSS